ncbi:enoyl-CoA hydratase/isomerase family protein [Roseiterribacter gracilis]|uniref:3-hydroxyisobutyryl-CoA hydrolase n=1 Tax=Roseiterribacter gracilis TaxID=2812848 RepID=A0A8S8XCV8_9PROT|nr:enoyl-CoA hydratase [Rhodospirillales bacterium TMPK1]
MTEAPEVLFERRGSIGIITLNRPKALNALTTGMCAAIDGSLRDWGRDPAVRAIITRGTGGRAYCAGGDVRAVAESGARRKAGDDDGLTRDFFRTEYRMNRRLQRFEKPLIALIDGVTMGGGIGLSMHGSHRVATERTLAAMPETGIGLFPDVGASYVLPRLPGAFGLYLALTGARLGAADLAHLGMATDVIESARLDDLVDALVAAEWNAGEARAVTDGVLKTFRVAPTAAPLAEHKDVIDACFALDTVEAILAALDKTPGAFASETAATIRTMSPTSCKISHEEMRRGRDLSFDDCMRMEYRLTQSVLADHDFYEGIRALLIDKDKQPKWKPATLAEVGDVARYFAAPADGDLTFED